MAALTSNQSGNFTASATWGGSTPADGDTFTIAAGHSAIEQKVKLAKPEAKVTTPSTAAVKALKKLKIKKIAVFTPYIKDLNNDVIEFFKKENFSITSNSYFDIKNDIDIGKVDQNYLYDVLSKIDLKDADALFVSCTALPVLSIIDKLEKKFHDKVNQGYKIISNNKRFINIDASKSINQIHKKIISHINSLI